MVYVKFLLSYIFNIFSFFFNRIVLLFTFDVFFYAQKPLSLSVGNSISFHRFREASEAKIL